MQIKEEEGQNFCNETQCVNCEKKVGLIHKYEKLIKLLKKKQLRTSSQLYSKLSNGKTTSYASQETSNIINASRVYQILVRMISQRYGLLWRNVHRGLHKKSLIASMCSIGGRVMLKTAFEKMREDRAGDKLDIMREIDQRLRFTLLQTFHKIKKNNTDPLQLVSPVFQQNGKSEIREQLHARFKVLHSRLQQKKYQNKRWLQRRNIELEVKNYKLQKQNSMLKKMLDESSRRQHKQNEKKRESLEMLAQELLEKNDLIQELQGMIKKYESKYELCNNVLEDDAVLLRKEVQSLEIVRDRLQNQLMRVTRKLEGIQERQKELTEQVRRKDKDSKKMKQKLFELQTKESWVDNQNKSLTQLIHKLKLQMDKLKGYETHFMAKKRDKKLESSFFPPRLDSEAKTEIVLCFLENIYIPEYQIPSLELFDSQEQQVLINHQIAFQKYSSQVNLFNRAHSSGKKRKDISDLDEIEFKGGKNGSASIFGCMDSPKEQNEKQKNLSIRLLEMELQKNKQIEKISEMKEKNMHIRIIILNLLKSLQHKSHISKQTEGIMEILFDIFQYSEEQRSQMFAKKKKTFFNLL